eukprot:CAMPEP_0168622186 /NCGR_PEP_ID=MMETSP0449_2-20121227/8123_1 /TAXON_ID=1082188 /ORGANISM="Strombidium rassoulzadegani, Strain ras09" /LENGTH=100 /DNA_ID=CAMNT_0008663415 /DNA_START=174 /DNA_END=476 /DNA_ORIENTATION=+
MTQSMQSPSSIPISSGVWRSVKRCPSNKKRTVVLSTAFFLQYASKIFSNLVEGLTLKVTSPPSWSLTLRLSCCATLGLVSTSSSAIVTNAEALAGTRVVQ